MQIKRDYQQTYKAFRNLLMKDKSFKTCLKGTINCGLLLKSIEKNKKASISLSISNFKVIQFLIFKLKIKKKLIKLKKPNK